VAVRDYQHRVARAGFKCVRAKLAIALVAMRARVDHNLNTDDLTGALPVRDFEGHQIVVLDHGLYVR